MAKRRSEVFERGFKSYTNQLAIQVRQELGAAPHAPLCPWSLAEHLAIPVVPMKRLSADRPEIAQHVDYLAHVDSSVFSAITVFSGHKRIIIHNDAHAMTRQRSDLAHELGHALLMHPPHQPFGPEGERIYDRRLENEAGWIGPVLLVPNEAAHWVAEQRLNSEDAAKQYGVSRQLLVFRLRVSGALRRWGVLHSQDRKKPF